MKSECSVGAPIRESSSDRSSQVMARHRDPLQNVDDLVPATQRAELDRRLASFEADRRDAIPLGLTKDQLTQGCP
jgi:hypothetical protein